MFKMNKDGLIPCITQDVNSNEVLMLAYMNEEAIEKTKETKQAYYFSRSRQELWKKGETSGNTQEVVSFLYDCDKDTILLKVKQKGVACHTNHYSCFFNSVFDDSNSQSNIISELYNVIKERKALMPEGSYTTYLFEKGVDKILKKVAEESGEVIIAAKNNNDELIYEASDLLYHLLVLLVNQNVDINDIFSELQSRRK